jgi:hypothetical protein
VLIKGTIRINQKNFKDAYVNSPVSMQIQWLNTNLWMILCSDPSFRTSHRSCSQMARQFHRDFRISFLPWLCACIVGVVTFLILFHECLTHINES